MIKLKNILNEIQGFPKGDYVKINGTAQLQQIKQDIFDLIQTAYKPIGGHLNFKTPDDVLDPDITFWKAADIDADPELDVVYFGKETAFGIKHAGLGHDGDRVNIKNLLIRKTGELKSPGNYVELSGAAFDSFVTKGGVPTIDDEALARRILKGKDIEWHGAHPKGTLPGNGWYTRTIGGAPTTKILAGKPK